MANRKNSAPSLPHRTETKASIQRLLVVQFKNLMNICWARQIKTSTQELEATGLTAKMELAKCQMSSSQRLRKHSHVHMIHQPCLNFQLKDKASSKWKQKPQRRAPISSSSATFQAPSIQILKCSQTLALSSKNRKIRRPFKCKRFV